ncbi:hypothetical protein INT46_004614 [Mucor plumbeus]|uniref:Uncharacterized protein n=1 Tax=Mucor plumbeus TaxID=97098 RepID=A0A8H7V5A0_9FUNG|nr:hypothetical protein INT46_004614 [Mucor plumbeus]
MTQTTSNATETNSATATTTTTTSDNLISSGSISSTLLPSSSSLSSSSFPLAISSITPSFTVSDSLSTTATNANAIPTVQGTGWNSNENEQSKNQQSWLRQNNRFVFVIFVGLFVAAILIWYIVRSIKGMRKRLEQENQAQLYMIQQASSPPTQQQQQPRNDRVIPELTQTPPPVYKTEENTPVHQAEHR